MKIFYYLKKIINTYARLFWTPVNKIYMNLYDVNIGDNFKCRGKIHIMRHSMDSKITIGNNVLINSSSKANPIGCGDATYIQMVDGGELIIGNGCGISNAAFTCASKIIIGDNVLLGAGCKIYDTDFHALDYKERIRGNYPGAPIKTAPVQIGEGAFIGAGAYILKGVHIGKHSIIGAGSVVSRSVPDFEIWAGNPAKFIKKVEE